MKATILDLRRRMGDVLDAIERNETVTLLRRGKPIAEIRPLGSAKPASPSAEHEAFGMWKDRKDLADVEKTMDRLRRGRVRAD